MRKPTIVVVTGASGAGKTAAVGALAARRGGGVECFHFDSIGVPTPEEMERDHGGGERWQASATRAWLEQLDRLSTEIDVAVLDAQTRPSFVFDAAKTLTRRAAHVILLDCEPEVRADRLRGPRNQPDLATPRMDAWAAYLRGQADALELAVIDTSRLTIDDVADQISELIREFIETEL
jgi:dephospho-CoA kinase